MIICIYTDIIINGLSDKEKAEKAKQKLEKCYDVKIIKEVQMLEKFGTLKYKPRLILLPVGISLLSNNKLKTEKEKKNNKEHLIL